MKLKPCAEVAMEIESASDHSAAAWLVKGERLEMLGHVAERIRIHAPSNNALVDSVVDLMQAVLDDEVPNG